MPFWTYATTLPGLHLSVQKEMHLLKFSGDLTGLQKCFGYLKTQMSTAREPRLSFLDTLLPCQTHSTFSDNIGLSCLHLVPKHYGTLSYNTTLPAERVEDILTSQVHHCITLGQSKAGQLFLGRGNRDITHPAFPLLKPSQQPSSQDIQPVTS